MVDKAVIDMYRSLVDTATDQFCDFIEEFNSFCDQLSDKQKSPNKGLPDAEINRINQKTYEFRERVEFLQELFVDVEYLKTKIPEIERKLAKEKQIDIFSGGLLGKIEEFDVLVEIFQDKKYPLVMFSELDADFYKNPEVKQEKEFNPGLPPMYA